MKISFSFKDFLKSLVTPNPARDWAIALVILIILFATVVGYATYLFIGIRWGGMTGESQAQSVSPPSITKGELDAALSAFRARKANFDARNFGIPNVQDPSE